MNSSDILKRDDIRSIVREELQMRENGPCQTCQMKTKIEALEELLSIKDSEMKALQEELQAKESKISALEESVKTKDSKVKHLKKKVKSKDSKVQDLEKALEVERERLRVKELEEMTAKDSEVQELLVSLSATESRVVEEFEKIKGQLGATKRKLESIGSQSGEQETETEILKKRKEGCNSLETSSVLSSAEAVKIYLESMFKHFQNAVHIHHLDFAADKWNKLAAEKTLHEKLSAEVILKCETTKYLAEEQKEAVKSMLFILYKNCKGPSDISVLSSFPALVYAIKNSCRIPKPALIHVSVPKVTPLSLGFSTDYAKFHCVIPKNTNIPTKSTKTILMQTGMGTFSGVTPSTAVLPPLNRTIRPVAVYQGEGSLVADNTWLDEFCLTRISSSEVGETELISVTMEIDSEGALEVTAVRKTDVTNGNCATRPNVKIPAYKWILMDQSVNEKTSYYYQFLDHNYQTFA